MATPNTPNFGLNKGEETSADKDPNKTDCEENKENTEKGERELPDSLKEPNYAISSGGFAGKKPFKPSFSNEKGLKRFSKLLDKFLEGIGVKNYHLPLCNGDAPYRVGGDMQKGHTEIKILKKALTEAAGNIAGKKLVINVTWSQINKRVPGERIIEKRPCPSCLRAICKTSHSCGFTIVMCNDEGKEEDMKQFCEDGKPVKGSKQMLIEKLNKLEGPVF